MHSLAIICLLSIFFASVLAAPSPHPQLRTWRHPEEVGSTYLDSDTRDEEELIPALIDAPNEMWTLSIDRVPYYTTFQDGKWVKGGSERYNADVGILMGSFVMPESGKNLLHDSLKSSPSADMDVLWIYNTMRSLELNIRKHFDINIDLVANYLPYMKVMLEKKGSGAYGLITRNEEGRYMQTLKHLFPGNSGI
ncbi:hypothetical protein HHX47_DHR3000965 [Lentinula edodes]|nr:hypothetical protein HHX47_DHR3000965 [Lentinula edodes]